MWSGREELIVKGGERVRRVADLNKSILDAIGKKWLYVIVWRATPLPWRLIAFPYGVVVYRRLLAASDTLHYLRGMHTEKFPPLPAAQAPIPQSGASASQVRVRGRWPRAGELSA